MRFGRAANRRLASVSPARNAAPVIRPASGGPLRDRSGLAIALEALVALLALGAVVGFFAGGRALSRWIETSDSFAVRDVEVVGLEKLGRDEVLEAAGIRIGSSMFALDEAETGRALEAHPWIREARVRKRMPGSVRVEIVERELAVLLWRGALYRVDSDGTVFQRHTDGAPVDRVVVTGMEESWAEGDRSRIEAELRKIIQVMGEYERMGLTSLAPPTSIHREHGGGLVIYVGEDAREIRLGVGHTRKKLMRLRAVLDKLRREELQWDYVMVDSGNFPERVVVKLRAS